MEIVVLVKQVPDTANVGADAMKEDGTVNRAALQTVFNPDDLNALELALDIKDKYGANVTAISMGPPKAVEVLKESLYRGADRVYLVSDVKFAGSDTLATSLILKHAIEASVKNYDLVLTGRQAIDGDTAQVGPQVAEKLGIPQLTFVTSVESVNKKTIRVSALTDEGSAILEAKMPLLMTVEGDVNVPRPPRVKRLLKYMNAVSEFQMEEDWLTDEEAKYIKEKGLKVKVLSFCDLNVDQNLIGLSGSPTRVKEIHSVVFKSIESRAYPATQDGVGSMMNELVSEHIIG
ncbi:MAG: electron transfer flavoprotein subunit beta/FixA family protein [Oligoflexia bacterium]|nr:electron transfer flavoprotein subunit beta/FixA family protein [Oligoflexia bacterium]